MANIATEQSRGECTVHGLQWALNLQQAKFGRMIFMCIIIIITIFVIGRLLARRFWCLCDIKNLHTSSYAQHRDFHLATKQLACLLIHGFVSTHARTFCAKGLTTSLRRNCTIFNEYFMDQQKTIKNVYNIFHKKKQCALDNWTSVVSNYLYISTCRDCKGCREVSS